MEKVDPELLGELARDVDTMIKGGSKYSPIFKADKELRGAAEQLRDKAAGRYHEVTGSDWVIAPPKDFL